MKPYLLALFIFSALFLTAQDCSSIRRGIFYEYSVRFIDVITRNDSMEMRVSGLWRDTTFWKLNFSNDCIIKEKIIRTTRKINEDKRYSDTYIQEVVKITKEYYAYRGYWQSHPEHSNLDTAWMVRHRR